MMNSDSDSQFNFRGSSSLAAIVFTDVESFTTRMAANENHTVTLIERDMQLISRICQQFEGQLLNFLGDGLLIYFVSAEKAVLCAMEIQKALLESAVALASEDVLYHRIGIHLGDVVFSGKDVMGNGVNMASRLQKEALPGGICLSQTVYDVVKSRLADSYVIPLGLRHLKGIHEPVPVYQIPPPRMVNGVAQHTPPTVHNHLTVIWRKLHQLQLLRAIATSLLITFTILGIRHLGLLQAIELKAFDQMMQMQLRHSQEDPDPRIVVITVSEEDIQAQERGAGSISDATLNQLLKKLEPYQPRVIGLDIYRDYPVSPQYPDLRTRLQNDERIVVVCKGSDRNFRIPGVPPPPEVPLERQGFSDFLEDDDGVVRRHLLAMKPDLASPCRAQYAFSLQVAFRYLAGEQIMPEVSDSQHIKFGNVILQGLQAPTNGYQKIDFGGYQLLLNYRATQKPAAEVSLTQVLKNQVDLEAVRDRIVLVGVTAQSAGDYWGTPYGAGAMAKMPGVIVQTHMVSQILSAVLDQRPLLWVWSGVAEAIWIWGGAIVGILLAWRFRSLPRLGIAIIVTSGALYGICLFGLAHGGWIPWVPTTIVLIATSGTVTYMQSKLPSSQKTLIY